MAKKKKKTQARQGYNVPPREIRDEPRQMGLGDAIHNKGEAMAEQARQQAGYAQSPADIAARQAAVQRLTKAMHHMGEPPESVLELLDRLEIPWERAKNVAGDESYDTLVIRWSDLLDGERRNQEQGSVLKRLYGNDIQGAGGVPTAAGGVATSEDQRFAMAMEKLATIKQEKGIG